MDSSRRRRSRSNLHLNLAPLQQLSSPTADDSPATYDASGPRSSYIAGKSAPTTPGILSRTASGKSLSSRSYTHLAFADFHERPAGGGDDLSGSSLLKSKSTTGLAKKTKKGKARKSGDDEWFSRIGAAVAGETRESKGQNWLMTRASSTSLVALGDEDSPDEERRAAAPKSRRNSRGSERSGGRSRPPSRPQSAYQSRRGSRVGSRVDLATMTPTWRSEMEASGGDYFGGQQPRGKGFDGPDFVEDEEEEEVKDDGKEDGESDRDEDDEIAELAGYRGWGFGAFVDRLIGWNLFDVEGTEEEEEEEKRPARAKEGLSGGSNVGLREIVASDRADERAREEQVEKGQAWKDAAWLLSVASKVVF